ncbi:arabinose-proton symporter [Tothia fuscella]|uniref:Arabinose-proton symporter n=1 Tax=Tothia fuscella TaxID=1048955 RepID=A0A9P4U3W9_9PEZI|nr:arabinose-proton symporter [Tothia fuscella]
MGKLIPNTFNLLVVIAVALGSTACSYGMAVISSTIGQAQFYRDMDLAPQGSPGYDHTANMIGALNALNSAGSAIGAIFCAWSADKYGRLRSIQAGAIVMVIGGALCAGSVNLAMFLVARFIAGWGIGMLITTIPMYQAEVSTPEARGFMVSMHGVMFAMGYSLAAWIGFGCFFANPLSSFTWRFPLAFQMVPALLLLASSPWLPFSPRWLLQENRPDEAHDVLKKLHYNPKDSHERAAVAAKEFHQMKKQLEMDRQINAHTSIFELFKTAPNRRRAWVGFSLMFGNQFTGSLIIANYGVLLYISLGMKTYMPLLLSALWVTASFPGNILTAFFIDRIGRRIFMLTGLAGLLISLIGEAAMQAEFLESTNVAGQRAAIFFIFLFIFFWSTFLDASQYLYLAEIFPTHIRSQGMAFGMVGLYLGSIILLLATPVALEKIKWKYFLVLIIPTALHWVNVYFLFPETKQRSLEDINLAFGEKVAVHYYGATEAEEQEYSRAMEAENKQYGGPITTDSGKGEVTHVEKV